MLFDSPGLVKYSLYGVCCLDSPALIKNTVIKRGYAV